MIITDITTKSPGDVVWAFAYKREDRVRGQKLRQTPVQGILLSDYYQDFSDIGVCIDKSQPVRYFMPFGKNGQPKKSAVINICSRQYADNELDAIKGYNLAIKREIEENEKAIQKHREMLIPTLDQDSDEDGYYKKTAVYRADMAVNADEILHALKDDLIPLDTCPGELMSWEKFIKHVNCGGLTDNDGMADLIINGRSSSNSVIWITTEMVNIYDRYLIPFERIPEIFEGFKIEVMWFNK